MSRGNIFVSPKTQHYMYIPKLEAFGLAFMDAYAFNTLANPSNPIARRYREVSDHPDVGIYNYADWSALGMADWLINKQNCDYLLYEVYASNGDIVPRYVDMDGGLTSDDVNLAGLINYVETNSYEQRQKDYHNGNEKAVLLHAIQTSITGYLIGVDSNNYSNGIKVYFPQPWANRTSRQASLKGNTLYSAVPRRASGAKYHYRGSISEDEGVHTGTGAGLSNDDHSATVSGPLKMRWNPAQNVWEAGNTFLAVLLTDVDGANVKQTSVTQDNINNRSSEEFYASDGVERMNEFTTGLAMPVNLQSSNPRSFGPNLLKCGGEDANIETIRVVNRSRTNFNAGERVLVYQIDGENIIGKFTEETVEERTPIPGRWNFTKFMSNSDEYFRYTFGDDTVRPQIEPEAAAQALYAKYYSAQNIGSITEDGARISMNDVGWNKIASDQLPIDSSHRDTFKLFEYWQTRTTDHMDSVATGGTVDEETGEEDPETRNLSYKPMFGGTHHRINIEHDPTGGDAVGQENVLGTEIPLWFGPMFPDGMVTQASAKGYKFHKLHTPADVAYPYFWNAHSSMKKLNEKLPKIIGVSGVITSSGVSMPNNLKRVQFNFLQPDLMGCGDLATIQLPADVGDVGRFGTANTSPRMFPSIAARHAGFATGKNYDGSAELQLMSDMFSRRSNEITNVAGKFQNPVGPAMMYYQFEDPGAMPYCFKYDAYIDFVPLSKPINAPALFGGDTGPESKITPGEEFFGGSPGIWVGANAVGITSARLTLNQGSGDSWNLQCDTNQTFGMKGRFYGGGGGGGIYVTIIGAMMAFANDTRGKTIEGSVPMWGSNLDRISSFGTGCCHVQVWDAWPDEFTAWCPQYMFALHKNPVPLEKNVQTQKFIDLNDPATYKYTETVVDYSEAEKDSEGDWAEGSKPKEIQINVGYPSTMTFKEPTYGDTIEIDESTYQSFNTGRDGELVGVGDTVTSDTKLRPVNLWYNNRMREGKLCSLYGYHHRRRVLGVKGSSGVVKNQEEGFLVGDYRVGRGDKELYVEVKRNKVLIKNKSITKNDGTTHTEQEAGAGYLPSDLPVSYMITDGLGKTCTIEFPELKCYEKYYIDQGPKPRSNLSRVSKASSTGTDTVIGNKGTSIMVEGNKNTAYSAYPSRAGAILDGYEARYEVFVYVHNDVSFTFMNPPESTTGYQFAQYITLSLG